LSPVSISLRQVRRRERVMEVIGEMGRIMGRMGEEGECSKQGEGGHKRQRIKGLGWFSGEVRENGARRGGRNVTKGSLGMPF
jgi:hypothetical protein